MSIRVTCGKCHTRFNVSEKFAGKEGPCPKCKSKIKIPAKSEEVKVHEPEFTGPKDTKGRAVLDPIRRKELVVTPVHITLVVALIVGFLICALIFRFMFPDLESFPSALLWISAIAIAPPICFVAYLALRDAELGSFVGKELWTRILICSAVYALLWFAMPLGKYAFSDNYETGSWVVALAIMLAGGATAGMLSFDLDYLMGLVHYGMYLALCLLGRLIAGIGVLPGSLSQPDPAGDTATVTASLISAVDSMLALIGTLAGC
jgi:DNA-directed RNA polymerase subunit RPC12/RpoP